MIKKLVKVSELSGRGLDYATALTDGWKFHYSELGSYWEDEHGALINETEYRPSSRWTQGGLIIEREGIDLYCGLVGNPNSEDESWRYSSWRARYHRMGFGSDMFYGREALIAAMRAYVETRHGPEVEIPAYMLLSK